ncbi:MAG TPA: outer membrane lipid asymmetry maintenance protein MlaD [Acidiferrobacter sp.]|nr:outer membrane lipid asymmetry maintenance protein MlaD [Acidiferrobacter sp.]
MKNVEFAVGLFVVAGLLALAMLALKVGNVHVLGNGASYSVTADFTNIGSLKPEAPVTVAGVRVGQVAHIAVDPVSYRAVVTLNILDKYRFPIDSSASIVTAGLLGEQYISLDPGGSQRNLKNGDKIQVTQSAIILEQIISQLLYSKAGHS